MNVTYNGVTHTVTKRQGWTLDNRTAAYFDAVNKAMPGGVLIIQGAFSRSVGASAGTHAGPGALDLKPMSSAYRTVAGYKKLETVCRQLGGAAWFRQWSGNYHVHLILKGTAGLPRVAANQVVAYNNGRDGLVSNLRISGVLTNMFNKVASAVNAATASISDVSKVKLLQKAVRTTADGVWGKETDIDVGNTRLVAIEGYSGTYFKKWNDAQKKRMQKSWGAFPDGIWGPATAAWCKKSVIDIQAALGVTRDGVWGKGTDNYYNVLRNKMHKVATPPKPPTAKPPAVSYENIAVNLSSPIRVSNIRSGKTNSDVARYQAQAWNQFSKQSRINWCNKWGVKRSQVNDGLYGKATADMTKQHYAWRNKVDPKGGWTPNANEPGAGLLRFFGFTNVK